MTSPHAAHPGDLVALVSFDGEVVPNQAVTREQLGRQQIPPHAIGAVIQQWLGRDRRVWLDVRGRQVQGIATARELGSPVAWEIDTLVDASGSDDGEVVYGLLTQTAEAAAKVGVRRLVLRLRASAPALVAAERAGFVVVLHEQLWAGYPPSRPPAHGDALVRPGSAEADAFFEFQLYSRALPAAARALLGMTFDEWVAVQERRWTTRAREFLAFDSDHVRAVLYCGKRQLTLLAEPGAEPYAAAALAAAAPELGAGIRLLALLPECSSTPAKVLREWGLEPGEDYALLVLRTAQPVIEAAREGVRIHARTAVPTGG